MKKRRREAVRAALSEAMVDLSWERGYGAFDVSELCGRAGIERSDFEALHGSLEDCLCETIEEMNADFFYAVAISVFAEIDWRAQIRAAAYAMLRFYEDNPRRGSLMLVEAYGAGERVRLIRDQGFQTMVPFIDQGRQCLEDHDSLTVATAEAMAATIYDQMRKLVAERREIEAYWAAVPGWLYTVFVPYVGHELALEELTIAPPGPAAASAH